MAACSLRVISRAALGAAAMVAVSVVGTSLAGGTSGPTIITVRPIIHPAATIVAPRDASTGMATGRRTWAPMRITVQPTK